MGPVVHRRLVRKLDLERFLSEVEPHPTPNPNLEQYTIPADTCATILHIAAYTYGDIAGKTVLDLGCGTGRLALGAAFLGAKEVVGVDLDRMAIDVAMRNSRKSGLVGKTQWIIGEIDAVDGIFDTVLQNPPYGVQTRGADRAFLQKALETGKAIYSLHKGMCNARSFISSLKNSPSGVAAVAPSPFIKRLVERRGGKVKAVYAMLMTIPHMFAFHTKTRHEFVVDLYVIEAH